MRGVVFEIREFSLFDGPGIRTTVFLKGCPLRCRWCHNPEGIAPRPQLLFHAKSCSHCGNCRMVCPLLQKEASEKFPVPTDCQACGRCAAACPTRARRLCGQEMESETLAAKLLRQADLFRQSGGGVTFSGGEPLLQAEFVRDIARRLHEGGVATALETSGFASAKTYRETIATVDLIFQDLKHPSDTDHRKWTGVSNGPILENLDQLKRSGKPFVVRIPVVPTANDSAETLDAFARILAGDAKNFLRVELLPYHAVGGGKYSLLGQAPPELPKEKPIPPEAAEPFRRLGLNVQIL